MKNNFSKLRQLIYSPTSHFFFLGLILAGLFSLFYLLRAFAKLLGDIDIPPSSEEINLLFFFLVSLILLVYYLAYRLLTNFTNLKLILLFSCLFGVILILVFPFASADVFIYVFYPKIFLFYHHNPYLVPLGNYTSDVLFNSGYVIKTWLPNPLAYGPTWFWSACLFTFWSLGSVASAVLSFELMAAFYFFASAFLIYKILSKVRPKEKIVGTALWLWSPLVLFEVFNNAHNDIIMTFFCLLSLYFLVEEKYFWVLPVFIISTLIKYFNIIFLPFLLIYLWNKLGRERKKDFTLSILFSILLAVLLWLPFWQGWETLRGMSLFNSIYNFKGISAVGFFARSFYLHWSWSIPEFMPTLVFARWVARIVFAYFYLSFLWNSRRQLNDIDDLFKSLCWVLFLFFLIFTFYLQTWYFILPLALMILVKGWPWRWFLAVTIIGLFNYFYMFVDLSIVFVLFIVFDIYFHRFFRRQPLC